MTASSVSNTTLRQSIERMTPVEVIGLLTGIAEFMSDVAAGRPELEAAARELIQRAEEIIVDIDNLVLQIDTGRRAHPVTPTFKLIGVGDGQPSGFVCDGCGQSWSVAPGQDAADLIPTLRQHAEAVTPVS